MGQQGFCVWLGGGGGDGSGRLSCVCLDRLGRDQEEEDGDEIG